jgi:hypothetical protein
MIAPQLTELYHEFLPYKAAGQIASFVPTNDLESLDVANGAVAVDVRAFVNTAAEVTSLGGKVTAVRYLPVRVGVPGLEVQAMLPIVQLPALGSLADVVFVTPEYRVGPAGSKAPSITTNPGDQTVVAGGQATFTAAASGVAAPTVQWQVSSDGGEIFINVPGATATTFSFTATARQNGDEFRAVFTNVLGQASTVAATLSIHTTVVPKSQLSAIASGHALLDMQMAPQQEMLGSPQDLLAATRLSDSELASILHVAAIDWQTQMVLFVSTGFGGMGAWSPQAHITDMNVSSNVLTVHWEWLKPNPNQVFPDYVMLTNPVEFVLVSRFDGPVQFQFDGTVTLPPPA